MICRDAQDPKLASGLMNITHGDVRKRGLIEDEEEDDEEAQQHSNFLIIRNCMDDL